MEATKILQADLLDLLFENRNKDYGAYELRKMYNKRVALSLLFTSAIITATVAGSFLSEAFVSHHQAQIIERVVSIEPYQPDKNTPPPPPPAQQPTPPPVATNRFTTLVIKPSKEVQNEELPPVEDLAKVDVITTDGVQEDIVRNLPTVDNGKGIIENSKKNTDDDGIVDHVEVEAGVNMAQWRRHLESQLQRYIEDAANAGMAAGKYTVQVRFLVEKDGTITDVKALNDPGYGLAKGAEEVLKKGPRWSPGEQNGRKVRSYHTQPISFIISE